MYPISIFKLQSNIVCNDQLNRARVSVFTFHQGWVENSTPGIYRWNLPVFPGMANKAQVVNNGKYNFFAAKYWQI